MSESDSSLVLWLRLTCSLGSSGVLPALVAEKFERPVGDHLVGVHVGRGAGAALDHIDDELFVQRAGADFLTGLDDGLSAVCWSSRPSSRLASAAACLMRASARIRSG